MCVNMPEMECAKDGTLSVWWAEEGQECSFENANTIGTLTTWWALETTAVSPWLTDEEQDDQPGAVAERSRLPTIYTLEDLCIPEMSAEGDGTSYQSPGAQSSAKAARDDDFWTTFQSMLLGAGCSSRHG